MVGRGSSTTRGLGAATLVASVGTLEGMVEDGVHQINEELQEWEDIEFLVDSGAGTTVIGPEPVKAVRGSDPDPSRTYKLADGSLIMNKGHKTFNEVTEDNQIRYLGAHVTDVDKPLLSVSHVVAGESEVVFSPSGSYIASPGGKGFPLSCRV